MKKTKDIGSTLESLLQEEGILEEVRVKALKTAIAFQIEDAMKKEKLTQSEVCKKNANKQYSVYFLNHDVDDFCTGNLIS